MIQIEIAKKHIVDALTIFKSSYAVTDPIVLQVQAGVCIMSMFNNMMALKISFDLDDPNAILASPMVTEFNKLLAFLKGSPEDIINIQDGKQHTVTSGTNKLRLSKSTTVACLYNWDALGPINNPLIFKDASQIARVAKELLPFVTASHHSMLTSIKITSNVKKVVFSGTDSYRIGRVELHANTILQTADMDVVIPSSILSIIERLTKESVPLSMGLNDNTFRISTERSGLCIEAAASRVLGKYPDLKILLDALPDITWSLNATDLVQYCSLHKTVGAATNTSFGTFSLGKTSITLKSSDNMNSTIENVERITAPPGTEDTIEINLSLKFILDAVGLIALNGSEKVNLCISNTTGMLWLTSSVALTDLYATAIIVPIVQ